MRKCYECKEWMQVFKLQLFIFLIPRVVHISQLRITKEKQQEIKTKTYVFNMPLANHLICNSLVI